MKNSTRILLLTCLKASELVEKKLHYKLSFIEKIQLKFHKRICDACNLYEKQSILLEKGIKSIISSEDIDIDISKLQRQIKENLKLSE